MAETFDFIIIGSGFGGSVSAMRLAQKGYKVAVLEKGKRYQPKDFAKTNWELKKFLWAPLFKCFGIQQISLLKGVMLLHGAGVGGGSLVYANTLMQPQDLVFESEHWPKKINWKTELAGHYLIAKKMLGVTQNKIISAFEPIMQDLAKKMQVENSFHLTEVGVYFNNTEVRDQNLSRNNSQQDVQHKPMDPYFNGAGPTRSACTGCGACMVGCRDDGKNTLDKNYLYFAEKWGTQIFSELEVNKIIPQYNILQSHKIESYLIEAQNVNHYFKKKSTIFRAKKVIVASGVLGTIKLLLKNKEMYKTLPQLSSQLGFNVKTNGESLCGVTTQDTSQDLSKGIAIGSAIHPDQHTKIEPVRYNAGSSVMRFLALPLTAKGNLITRPIKFLFQCITQPKSLLRLLKTEDWAKQSIILLVMQSLDFQMQLKLGRSVLTLGFKSLVGKKQLGKWPNYLETAQVATKLVAEHIKGVPQNAASEVLLGIPATAHILGGCNMADDILTGVINHQHEVFNYAGLYVCDGSVIPANLGVNPSLTITALAERFCHHLPIHDENLFQQRQITFSEAK